MSEPNSHPRQRPARSRQDHPGPGPVPAHSKDVIKEAHADTLGAQPPHPWPQRRWNASLGAAASDTMWALLADAPGGAILESC